MTAGTYGYSCSARAGGIYESFNMQLAASGAATVSFAQFAAAGCANSAMIVALTGKYVLGSSGVNQYRQRSATPMDHMVQYPFSVNFIAASNTGLSGCTACAGASAINSRTKYTVDRSTTACTYAAAQSCPILAPNYGNMLISSATAVSMSQSDPTFSVGDAYVDLTYSNSPTVSSFVDYVPLFGSASAVVPSIVLVLASVIAVLMF